MRNRIKALLALGVIAVALEAFFCVPALGATPRIADPGESASPRALDFNAAVGVALRRSPFFTKSALEIDLRRLDESDQRSALLPSITIRTRYFVSRPEETGLNPRAYSVEFVSEDYNPIEAYYSLKASKLFTKIAILGHLQVISRGLHRLAQGFLQLDNLSRLAGLQDEAVKLAGTNLAYARERQKLGETNVLEVKAATQELELAELEKKRLVESQVGLRSALRSYLGLDLKESATFDLRITRQQVLASFDAAAASLVEAQRRSFELKIQNLKKEIQAWNVILAKTKLLPTIFFGVETPDPLTKVDAHGYYFSIGLKLPVWDGFRRMRNISRQKTILKQFDAEMDLKEVGLEEKWREAQEHLQGTFNNLKLAKAQEELARLKARQGEIRYQAGEPMTVFLEARKGYLEAQKQTALKTLERDLAVLGVRHLSEDLVYQYVDTSSWQN